ncbi:MAG: tetratricopeptide repeat protein [Blastocatellia bacterium]|nr:tetratricopeptide repeat protein [Blastocatellia bacterium]
MAKLEYAPYNPLRGSDTSKEAVRTRENIERAIRLLKSADSRKETYETKHRLGQSLFIAGRYKEAIEELEKAATLSPDNIDIINDLAVAYAANKELDRAKAQISKSLKIKPDYLPSIFNRSLIYEILDEENKAIESWNEYLNLDNSSRWKSEAEDSKKELEKISK